MSDYQRIPFPRFLLALGGLAVPALMLERSNEQLARRYVGLLLMTLVILNYRGLNRFVEFLLRELRRT